MKGKILVFIQITCLLILFWQAEWFSMQWWSYAILAVAFGLGLWSIVVMRIGNFNVIPVPVKGGVFVQTGPYKLIRHPMYLSLVLAIAGFVSNEFSWINSITACILIADLIIKLEYEETLLLQHFESYKNYRLKTKKLIPFLY